MRNVHYPLAAWQDVTSKIGALPSFREVKRQLKHVAFASGGQPKNRVLFTNLERSAGSTTCALALMQSISLEQDTTALFIDTNVFNPTLTETASSGLMGYLNPQTTQASELNDKLIDIILHDNSIRDPQLNDDSERLRWMSLGTVDKKANEYFASARMQSLLKELSERYKDRLIVLDGPSILKSAEGRTLIEHVDQIVVVINEGSTLIADIERFKKLIPSRVQVHYLLNNSIDRALSDQYQTLSV